MRFLGISLLLLLLPTAIYPEGIETRPVRLNLADFHPAADGLQDDTPAFLAGFQALEKAGGTLIIPPGTYLLRGDRPIPLSSRSTIEAYGARILLPRDFGPRNHRVLFQGRDVSEFMWLGGHFQGYCFDPSRKQNPWEPNANTRMILIETSPGGHSDRLTFRDIHSDHVAGAVVTVLGASASESEVITPATNVTLDNCTLLASGKFMWDYGYLWQITVWPEEHSAEEIAMAGKYFRNDLIRGPLRFEAGSDRILVDTSLAPLPVSREGKSSELVCFYGDRLPPEIVRGRGYAVVDSSAGFLCISEKAGGRPIRFSAPAGPATRMIVNLGAAFSGLYAPTGAGPGKGAFDLTACRGVRVSGCKLSALGDTMHIHSSRDVVFSGNHILGSRMGAFFIAEYCANVSATGNLVDGTNGSRVMSVERSARDVTIVGNTFRNGGRGSWINQPTNLILQGNIFVNNTTKCEKNPQRGRRSYLTGDYQEYDELYFTTYQPEASYGNILIRDNIFLTGPEATETIRFAPGGKNIVVSGNLFQGPRRSVKVAPGCAEVTLKDNSGLTPVATP